MKPYNLLILIIALTACETVVDVEIPREAPKLVINSTITPSSLIHVHISQSRYILDETDLITVNNASVSIFEEGVFKGQLPKTQYDGLYASNLTILIPEAGKTYTLKAEAPGFASVEATTFLPHKVPIQTITLDSVHDENNILCLDSPCSYPVNYEVDMTFHDPANMPNYYSVVASAQREHIKADSTMGRSIEPLLLSSKDASLVLLEFDFEDNGHQGYELWFSDEIFDGQTYTFSFEVEEVNYYVHDGLDGPVEIAFELKHQSEVKFKYQISLELQNRNDGNPFAEPVPVYNNIENGYGIFAGYSADTKIVKP